MAESTITVQAIAKTGLNYALAAANADGSKWANTGREFIMIANGDGSPHTITVNARVNCSQGYDHDVVVVVPAGENRMIGPFLKGTFNDATAFAHLTYTAVTSVTVAVIQLPFTSV